MAKNAKSQSPVSRHPKLGLVCLTADDTIRYRTLTRTRYLALTARERPRILAEIYHDNIKTLQMGLEFCQRNDILLYRMPSSIFPFADTESGLTVLQDFAADLAKLGAICADTGMRVVAHPDQFVVLSSDSPDVIANSITVLKMHADIFDMIGLTRSPWNAVIIHGGKRGNANVLKRTVRNLPDAIRSRLCLENDEISYSSAEILSICLETGVSMIFDAHHHLVMERCQNYDHPGISQALAAARETWHPHEDWQLVHISNGADGLHDRRHSDFIEAMPGCFANVEWIEVEARGKDAAIARLRETWTPAQARTP